VINIIKIGRNDSCPCGIDEIYLTENDAINKVKELKNNIIAFIRLRDKGNI